MKTKYRLLSIIFTTSLVTTTVQAYDPDCTHRALTRRSVELYAKHYGEKFNANDIDNLTQGAYHEDMGSVQFFRSTNHFYDYPHNKPWTDIPALLAGSVALSPCLLDAYLKGNIHTAKEWALNPVYQQLRWEGSDIAPCSYSGDYSWPTILAMLDTNAPLSKVSFAAGHILHLIQDLTVPAHTRNDTHFFGNSDELEVFAKKQCDNGSIPSGEQLYNEGLRPIVLGSFPSNFDELAKYTYSHYLSRDTKFSKEYDLPNKQTVRRGTEIINRAKHTFLYTTDTSLVQCGLKAEYRLIEIDTLTEILFPKSNDLIYKFTTPCNQDYWQRTMRKAIAYGAGVLRKLVLEAENRGKCSITSRCLSCTPTTTRCSGGTLFTCNMSGTGENSSACPSGMCQSATMCKPPVMGGACGMGCTPPEVCSTNGCVGSCGGKGEYCCEPGKKCSIPGEDSFCDAKASLTCSVCGNTYQSCCPTVPNPCPKWTEGLGSVCDTVSNMCWPCGKWGMRCCETGDVQCEPDTMCYPAKGTDDNRCLKVPDP